MKILIVTHYFLPHKAGIEIVAYNQAKTLVKKGHKVTILSSKIGKEPEKEVMNGINIVRIPTSNFFEEKFKVPYPLYSPKIIKSLKEKIKESDLIYIHDISYMSSFMAALITKLSGKEYFLMQHIRNIQTKSKLVNLIQSTVFLTYGNFIKKKSKKIIVCNEVVSDWLNQKHKTQFIRNGVDIELFKPASRETKIKLRKKYKLPQNKKIVLFVGRFVEKKGYDKMFEARSKDYQILMVGEGEIPDYMKNTKEVTFMKSFPQEKLREIYQLSDLFCLPSKNEGFPLTILEAMSSGLPIITSTHPGYDKYLNQKYTKMINPTPINIKRAISEVLKSKKLANNMSKYSRKAATSLFSWEMNVNKLLEVFKI